MATRITFVSYRYWPPDFGGELLLSIERFKALAARGFEITALTSGRLGFTSHECDEGIRIYRSPVVGTSRPARLVRRLLFFLWALAHLVRMPMDVLHLGDGVGVDYVTSALCIWCWALVARLRGALTVGAHMLADTPSAPFDTHGWRGWLRASEFRVVDRVVCNSPMLHSAVEAALPGKSVLIVNGVRDDYVCQLDESARASLRARLGLTREEDLVFVFEGSVGLRKGFDVLAKAFAGLAPAHPAWRLWVIGPRTTSESQNIDPAEVAAVTRPLGEFASQVTFWGRINDRLHTRDLLCAADVFVFPTRREGLGVAPLEAMATGLPLIISRIPGATDLANIEGETGLFVEPGDERGLQGAMLRLGESLALRQRMGAAARRRIMSNFSFKDYIDQWAALYSGFATQ